MGFSRGDQGNQAERLARGAALLARLEAMPVTFVAFWARSGVAHMSISSLRHGKALSTHTLNTIEQTLALIDAEGPEVFTAKAERCAQVTAAAERRMRVQPGKTNSLN